MTSGDGNAGRRADRCSAFQDFAHRLRGKFGNRHSQNGQRHDRCAAQPLAIFADRSQRLKALAEGHALPMLDPVADDVATLALDLLLRDLGYRRGAVDPFLLGF